jgi:pilus assembly protein CpaB
VRPNSILIVIVAIVMGGIAAFLARNWLLSRTEGSFSNGTIVAAARQLPFGTTLTDDNVEVIPWAAKTAPPGAFASKQELFKEGRRITLAVVERDEPILNSKITGPGQRASLSTLLDEQKRAITVRVDDVRGVAGFIQPNDRVDVVLIRSASDSSSRRDYSDLLLQDVKVIGVDQIASERNDHPVVAKAVTLEVTPYQAQKISLATSVGHLSLILRKAGDSNVVADRRVTEADLAQSAAAAAPPVSPPAPAAPVPAPATKQLVQNRPTSYAVVTVMRNMNTQDYNVLKEKLRGALTDGETDGGDEASPVLPQQADQGISEGARRARASD